MSVQFNSIVTTSLGEGFTISS